MGSVTLCFIASVGGSTKRLSPTVWATGRESTCRSCELVMADLLKIKLCFGRNHSGGQRGGGEAFDDNNK